MRSPNSFDQINETCSHSWCLLARGLKHSQTGFLKKKLGGLYASCDEQALFGVSMSINFDSHFDTLAAELATFWAFEGEVNLSTVERLFLSSPDRSLCGQLLESRPEGTDKSDFRATPTEFLMEAVRLFEPGMDILKPDTSENENKEKRERLLGLHFTTTSSHTSGVELATLCFHKPFNVEMIKAMVEQQTGVHNIPDWLVRGSLEQMRQKKILFIEDGMFINSNWLDSNAPLAPLLLPSGSPVH